MRAVMRVLLLICLSFGIYAHYEAQRTGHRMRQLKDHTMKKQPKKKLFLGTALVGAMKIVTHVAAILSVVDVTTSLLDRYSEKPKNHEDKTKKEGINEVDGELVDAETEEDVELVDENTDEDE
ncbi:uncharacterized protein LOC133530913 [Cydia pomonella]|uniref:uncharacterized protein LOC133530913 n=1 Tax=Cydia pomonella TaxID=82600 RepID=UPI002ADD3F55|nr:uncharacterized protein LOC133530913 [Cydia pomonella]